MKKTPLSPGRPEIPANSCETIREKLDAWLNEQKAQKTFHLDPCSDGHEEEGCPCSSHGGGRPQLADLIVLIDTSGSMSGIAKNITDAAKDAIEQAQLECPSDLRVTWLGVDDRQPGSSTAMPGGFPPEFAQTHEMYLTGVGYSGPFVHNDTPAVSWPGEQGANAIQDLAGHFDWRKNACRAIFYISDTTLDADYQQIPQDSAATANAVTAALANEVTVFAHFVEHPHPIGYQSDNPTATAADYVNLCNTTGGEAMIGGASDVATYKNLLKKIICNACGTKCKEVELPEIQPCISVHWGDSDCDCLETDDYEVLYVTVCNCFSNLTFANFSIAQITVTNADNTPVATLPDGTDSVEVRPRGPICFGNIGPCVDGAPSCKSREAVLYTRGAKDGKYKLKFEGICFDIIYGASTESCFEFNLCYS